MDHLKSCYSTVMRVRIEPEVLVPVRWYFAPPGALLLPTSHAFGSMVWENTDHSFPAGGLGEVDLQRKWDKGKPPAGVTGQSTRTPLSWFKDGLPPDFVYPPPNAAGTYRIDLREQVSCVAGTDALLTSEGALALLNQEMPRIRQWEFLLFVWPPSLGDTTAFADLQEASFPGYSRLTPDWTTPVVTGPSQANTYATTLSWTRAPGAGSQTIFGWAAMGPELPARLRSVQLLPTPITLDSAGQNVTLCPIQLLVGVCYPALQQSAAGGDSEGGTAVQVVSASVQQGHGGDSEGGTASQFASPIQTAAGGDSEGGTATQFSNGVQTAAGGDSEGGTAVQRANVLQVAAGGDSEGGTAVQVYGPEQVAAGGDSEGGTAEEIVGAIEQAKGGDSDGGTATQGAGATSFSLSFDGTGYVSLDPSLLATGVVTTSLSVWLKTLATGINAAILAYGEEVTGHRWLLYQRASDDLLVFDFYGFSFRSNSTINDGDWHHIGFTLTAAGVFSIYIDGSLDRSISVGGPDYRAGTEANFGSYFPSPASEWDGKMFQPAFWKEDLTADFGDLAAQVTTPIDYLTGLLVYYPLTEGSGTTAADSSSYGNDGTLNGGVSWDTDVP